MRNSQSVYAATNYNRSTKKAFYKLRYGETVFFFQRNLSNIKILIIYIKCG